MQAQLQVSCYNVRVIYEAVMSPETAGCDVIKTTPAYDHVHHLGIFLVQHCWTYWSNIWDSVTNYAVLTAF